MDQQFCSIVRDLLPLYKDHAISEETQDFVKKHLESCSDCQNYHQTFITTPKHQDEIKDQPIPETLHMAAIAKRLKKRRRRIGSIVIASFLVFIFVFSLIFNTSIIRGSDMEPTYGSNATVLVNKIAYLFYGPRNNDIVVFTIENDTWIKRVIAGPGDTVYYESGYLLVNGTSKDTAQWWGKTTNVGDQSYPLTITKDEYFVIGDSLDNSYDSRYEGCGTIKRSQITGKVLCRWFSLNSLFTKTTVATSSIPTK